MRQSNGNKMRLVALGVVAVVVLGGQMAIADFITCDIRPVEKPINSRDALHPDGCSFLHNGLKLYFTSGRDRSNSNHRDMWVAERESPEAPWGEAVNLGPNINKPGAKTSNPSVSPDDLELYFHQRYAGTNYRMRSTRASKDDPWGPAVEFTAFDGDLDFAPDGLSVYFGSRQVGGYGDRDIWVARRATTDDAWGEPVNLGPNVNDAGGQLMPSISSDGLALFFMDWATRGIFMSTRATTDDDWGPAIDAGPAVNGQRADLPEISPDGSTLYFRSARLYQQVSIKPVVDFDDDGEVGMNDLLTMIESWGRDNTLCDIGPMPWGDGVVDEADLEVLMEHWGKKTPIYVVIDDFESYTDEVDPITYEGPAIWNTWIDGFGGTSGAIVGYVNPPFAETVIVHSGFQAMPFFYDNDGTIFEGDAEWEQSGVPYYSETQRTWAEAQDWTVRDVEVLTLWFYGEPDNSAEPFYVALEDSVGNRKDIIHPDPVALTVNDWQQWRMPLAEFTDLDLAAIKIMYIGVGDPTSNQPGGSGLVRIDDIELRTP